MTRDEIRERVNAVLRRLAPDFDFETLDPHASLRASLAADSMDVLNFVVALHEELGVGIPERDYPKVDTLNDCVDYVVAAIAAGAAKRPA
jgi:acyl carrier protein